MGKRFSRHSSHNSTSQSNINKLSQNLLCPICKKEFFSKKHSYVDLNTHMDSHAEEELRASADRKQVPDNKTFPESEAIILRARAQLNPIKVHWSVTHIDIHVSRENILDDSLSQLLGLSCVALRSEFHIFFNGEINHDAGGLTKEWLGLVLNELFSSATGLFRMTTGKEQRYLPASHNDNSEYYILAGIIVGKAVLENIPLNCSFTRTVLKHLIGLSCSLKDIKYQDTDLYRSLRFIQRNSIENVFFENFAVVNGGHTYSLVDEGELIPVTEENKETYVLLRTEYEVYGSMFAAIEALKEGFFRVVPQSFLQGFHPRDLDYMICGNPVINLRDWKDHTEYSGELSETHRVVIWFWDVVFSFEQSMLRSLLQFVTGTPRVPIDGFAALRTLRGDFAIFKLVPMPYCRGALPRAHTCFNRLDLPLFPSKVKLREAFANVLEFHTLGFGLD